MLVVTPSIAAVYTASEPSSVGTLSSRARGMGQVRDTDQAEQVSFGREARANQVKIVRLASAAGANERARRSRDRGHDAARRRIDPSDVADRETFAQKGIDQALRLVGARSALRCQERNEPSEGERERCRSPAKRAQPCQKKCSHGRFRPRLRHRRSGAITFAPVLPESDPSAGREIARTERTRQLIRGTFKALGQLRWRSANIGRDEVPLNQ